MLNPINNGISSGSGIIKKSFSQAMDDLYEFDEFEIAAGDEESFSNKTNSSVNIEPLKGHAKQKLIPQLSRPVSPPPLEFVNWSEWMAQYVDELFTLRREDMEYVLEQLKKPPSASDTGTLDTLSSSGASGAAGRLSPAGAGIARTTKSFLWDDVYVGIETARSQHYKHGSNQTATTSAAAAGDAEVQYLPELPLSQELSIHQKHNKAIFDRINTILTEFYQHRYASCKHKLDSTTSPGISVNWNSNMAAEIYPVTLDSMRSYITRKLLDDQQQNLDVLVGKKAYSEVVECSILDDIASDVHMIYSQSTKQKKLSKQHDAQAQEQAQEQEDGRVLTKSKESKSNNSWNSNDRMRVQADMITDYILGKLVIDISRELKSQ